MKKKVLSNVGIVESEELVVQFVPLMGRLLELLSDKEEKVNLFFKFEFVLLKYYNLID